MSDKPTALDMLPWWRDRFDDIEDDARTLMEAAKDYPQLHGMIEGIRCVAANARDHIAHYIEPESPYDGPIPGRYQDGFGGVTVVPVGPPKHPERCEPAPGGTLCRYCGGDLPPPGGGGGNG